MLNGAAKSIERHGQMELSRQLKTRREEQGLSQDEVAKAIFVSRQTISNWETGRTYPDVQSLLLLSVAFDISIDELIKEYPEEVSKNTVSISGQRRRLV